MHTTLFALLIFILHERIASGQECMWKPSKATILYGVAGKPAHFNFESLTRSWNGNLFTWKLAESALAVYQYKSDPMPHFVVDETPSVRVIATSKYISNAKSEHNLTITSFISSDDGKQVTLQREGCSLSTEKTKPVTLSISCCDPSVFGNNASMAANRSTIKCNEEFVFICNKTKYQATYFTAICLANSTWNVMQHTCELKVEQLNDASLYQPKIGITIIALLLSMLILLLIVVIVDRIRKRIKKSRQNESSNFRSAVGFSFIDSTKSQPSKNKRNENDKNKTKKGESQTLRHQVLEGRASSLHAKRQFADAIECLEEQHMIQKTENSLLLMAECYVLESRNKEANDAIDELKNLLLCDVTNVIATANDLRDAKYHLRAIILLRIAIDMYKSDTSLPPDSIVNGIYRCFCETVYVVYESTHLGNKSNDIIFRYSLKFMEEMAVYLNAVLDADSYQKGEVSCALIDV